MIYFTLPNFYFNFYINNFFINLSNEKEEFFKEKIIFYNTTGNFPYCYWNGGYNNNYGKGALYNDFINCSEKNLAPLRFNCSNIFLKEEDFSNTMANLILNLNQNGSNLIEISNLNLYDFLHEKYPDYNFVFSPESDLILEQTSETINILLENKLFKIISLNENKSLDINLLKKIKQKEKIELTVNSYCNINCSNYLPCRYNSHLNQYNYIKENPYKTCDNSINYQYINPYITIEDIKEKYLPLGINHFRLSETISDKNDNLFIFLVNYFIKDEFKKDVYEFFIQTQKGIL